MCYDIGIEIHSNWSFVQVRGNKANRNINLEFKCLIRPPKTVLLLCRERRKNKRKEKKGPLSSVTMQKPIIKSSISPK